MTTTSAVKSHVLPPCTETSPAAAADAPCAPVDRKWVLVATILGSALAFMDGSVVNVALPTLQTAFGATSAGIQWVIQGYALFGAALLLPGGAIGDRYGRRAAFIWGVVLFALASAACAGSMSLGQLIAARSVQGIGAALLVPQGLSILSASFPAGQRGQAIGTWSAWTSVFAALGPVAGGWLMQVWSWRLIFLLNLPIAVVVVLLAPRIPESRATLANGREPSLDRLGALLATSAFAAIIYALSFAPQRGWRSPEVLWIFAGGILLLAAFLWSQAVRPNAMMPLALFAIPRFAAANLLTFLLYGALGGALYVIPFYLIQVRHYPPAVAGAVFLPVIVLMFFFSARAGALIPVVGERMLLFTGAALSGAGFAAFALLDGLGRAGGLLGYLLGMLPGVLLLGCGMTLSVAPLTTTVMSSVAESQAGIASAVNNTLSRLAGLVAVSLLGAVLAQGFSMKLSSALERSTLPIAAQQQMLAGRSRLHDLPVPAELGESQRAEASRMVDQAFLSGFRAVMLACAAGAWAGSFTVLILLRKRS